MCLPHRRPSTAPARPPPMTGCPWEKESPPVDVAGNVGTAAFPATPTDRLVSSAGDALVTGTAAGVVADRAFLLARTDRRRVRRDLPTAGVEQLVHAGARWHIGEF